ncbi:cytoskeleton-associated protein 4 [Terrapene carolina triunguis]|uniref:Cytoskeleton associated protein 4 n=1 Tax=Terrapene triunguis TaxID=2587831 RepID=A0A674JRM5_9SAUR|nr:cytoskeleton-associated protein 4 [Terrapene carolina triunguis]
MSAARQRSSKGSGSAGSEKGAQSHSGGADDVAKKQQQQQAPAKGSKAAAGGRPSPCSLGKAFHALFSLALVGAAVFSGWGVQHLLGEVSQLSLRHEGAARQREELAHALEGVVQKVHSLQATFGDFESMMKSAQHKQEVTEKSVKQGESEINRISEVLQKLQNEILKDLSDGIHVVKDARERDFMSLENTVEERLTELTRSINDNIAIFTEVQKRSQNEINDMKARVASLGEIDVYKHELKALKDAVDEMQTSMKTKEKAIESLKSTIESMESDVYTEIKALVNLKQELEKFKETADTEHLSLKAFQEKVLKAEESIMQLPDEIKRLDEDLLQIKANLNKQEENVLSKNVLETLEKNREDFEFRFRRVEDNFQSLSSTDTQQTEKMESLLSKHEEYESKLAALEEAIASLRSTSDVDVHSITDTVRSLSESQVSLYNDVDELRRSVSDLPNSADALHNIQKQVSALLDQEKPQMGQAQSQDYLEKLSSVEGSVDKLRSFVNQVESDLKMIRTAVDSLVAYSVKIETNENNVESVKSLVDDLRNDLDRLFMKVEKIHEKV